MFSPNALVLGFLDSKSDTIFWLLFRFLDVWILVLRQMLLCGHSLPLFHFADDRLAGKAES